jgi:transposase
MLPAEAIEVGSLAGLVESEAGGVVFVAGQATFTWGPGDHAARKLAALQLVEAKIAQQNEVAVAFDVDVATVWRWQRAYSADGLAGLLAAKRGPKGPRKLTTELIEKITAMDADGATLAEIGTACGLSVATVRRALGRSKAGPAQRTRQRENAEAEQGDSRTDEDAATDEAEQSGDGADGEAAASEVGERSAVEEQDEPTRRLPVLPTPTPRNGERALARAGLLGQAAPVFTEGAHLPLAGLALVLPALAATGLADAAREVYGALRAGFYGLRSSLLTLVFLALVGEPRAEGATRVRPADLGRLLGLDRGPEVKTIRRKLAELAARGRGEQLIAALARRHAAADPEALGYLYLDGHVRVYSGTRNLPKAHIARMRIAAPATAETWVGDARGDPVFVVTAPPAASLVAELRRLLPELRALVGPDRRVSLVFDRGGYSPEIFAEIIADGFDLLTYRKGRHRKEPARAFSTASYTDEGGATHSFELADRNVRLPLPRGHRSGRKTITLRQVTRRAPDGHQTPILASAAEPAAAEIAYWMGNRWRQENFFKYGRAHFALDALDCYAAGDDDPARLVPNPAKNTARKLVSQARSALASAEAGYAEAVEDSARKAGSTGRAALIDPQADKRLGSARERLAEAKAHAAATPARVPLSAVDPAAQLLDEQRKLVTHAIRMAAYNAESTLARTLRPHYARADDEGRALLREAFTLSGDLEIVGDQLHVRLDPASAPRRSRALAALAAELTATETRYPDTELTLVYSVAGYPTPA